MLLNDPSDFDGGGEDTAQPTTLCWLSRDGCFSRPLITTPLLCRTVPNPSHPTSRLPLGIAFLSAGTFFEASGLTARETRGAAVGHSGQVRHSGVAITRGERYLLVGFIGCSTYPYAADGDGAAHAERDGFCKFGSGAWERRPEDSKLVPRLLEAATASAPAKAAAGSDGVLKGMRKLAIVDDDRGGEGDESFSAKVEPETTVEYLMVD